MRSQQSGASSGSIPTASAAQPVPTPASGQGNIWDKRVPPVAAIEQFMKPGSGVPLPRSSFPVPQKPGGTPPVSSASVAAPIAPPVPPPPPRPPVKPPLETLLPKSNIPVPKTPVSEPVVPRKPIAPPVPPKPVQAPKEDIGLDLGFEQYVTPGTPPPASSATVRTAQPTPKPYVPVKPDANESLFSASQASNAAQAAQQPFVPRKPIPSPVAQVTATIPVQRPAVPAQQSAPQVPPAPVPPPPPPAPVDPYADLEKEKAALASERISNTEKKTATDKEIQELINAKQGAGAEVAPFEERERAIIKEVEDLERKEAGLQGEERRNVESARWVKTEERRTVEEQKWGVKKRYADMEAQLHAKEDSFVFLVKREKEIDARINAIGNERKRREIQVRLDAATKEKDTIVARRTALEAKLKDLRTEIANTESLERTIEVDRKKLIPGAQTSFEDQRTFSERRYTLEKRQHETEMMRWKLEDDLKQFTETFTKEDTLFQEAAKKENDIRQELALVP